MRLLTIATIALLATACGGVQGTSEIKPDQIAEFGDAALEVKTEEGNVSAKFDMHWFLFGMRIDVRAHDLVIDAGGEAANCLLTSVTVYGATFQWLAHDQHPLCATLLASGAITIAPPIE